MRYRITQQIAWNAAEPLLRPFRMAYSGSGGVEIQDPVDHVAGLDCEYLIPAGTATVCYLPPWAIVQGSSVFTSAENCLIQVHTLPGRMAVAKLSYVEFEP